MIKMELRWLVVAAALTAFVTGPAWAVKIGDPAPPLKIKDWVKGRPVDLKAGKGSKVHVVEFWATWCGPCRVSIPHLTALQKKFKDKGVVVVGVSDEKADTVRPFVKKMGDKMNFVVAVDDGKATSDAYMKSSGFEGLPDAFIVDKSGIVVWHGHPMENMDKALEQILAGTYDIETAKRVEEVRTLLPEYFELAGEGGDAKKAADLGLRIYKLGYSSSGLMNEFSWTILTAPGIKQRDLELAMKAGQAAYDGCQGKDASVVDTYARALFDNGRKAEAVMYQRQAVKICKDEQMREGLKKVLEEYEKAVGGTEG